MKRIFAMALVMLLLIPGRHKETGGPDSQTERPTSSGVGDPNDQTERPTSTDDGDTVTKPPAEYGSISGESPVPETRIGYVRAGTHAVDHAVSPSGIYFIEKPSDSSDASFIIYADHGSDTFIKLCGRPDRMHSGPDRNAYVRQGSDICYYYGYLYVISGEGQLTEACSLIRMGRIT